MQALEFSGKIEQGMIRLPKQYEGYENSYVRIIVLVEAKPQILPKKERMRLAFQKMEKANMFSRIENPTLWIKQLRNEWE